MYIIRRGIIAVICIGIIATVVACGTSGDQSDTAQADSQLKIYQLNQRAPLYNRSQVREDLNNVEAAQVHGVATTTFFFLPGVRAPYKVCPSIGFPIPVTSEVTNPLSGTWSGGSGGVAVDQIDPIGIYQGEGAGSWVICVRPGGQREVTYSEPDAHTEGGTAHWDNVLGIVDDGSATAATIGMK